MLTAEIDKGVKLSRLLDEIKAAFQRYLVLAEAQLVTLALYVVHTHAIEAAYPHPLLDRHEPDAAFRKDAGARSLQPSGCEIVVVQVRRLRRHWCGRLNGFNPHFFSMKPVGHLRKTRKTRTS